MLGAEVTIGRSTDHAAIRALLTDPRVYRKMANDSAPGPCDFPHELPGQFEYVTVNDRRGILAVFLLIPAKDNRVEVHFCFDPRAWGRTVEISKDFLSWLWRETNYSAAIGPIPSYNQLGRKLAENVGFRERGRDSAIIRKGGIEHDVIYMGLERSA